MMRILPALVLSALALSLNARALVAQEPLAAATSAPAEITALDSLLARALAANPMVRAAERRVDAARAAVGPAGALDDPMLMLGLLNQPLRGSMKEGMSMRAVGVSQMIPWPGKLALERQVAEHELTAAEAELDGARRTLAQEVQAVYYELALLDRSLEVLGRNERLLGDLLRLTETRYAVGTGEQPDVLKARVELARLAEEVVMLQQERVAALAELNALLDRPTGASVGAPAIPERIVRVAVAARPEEIRFTSAALGARATGSPLPALEVLQETALRENPDLRAQDARIRAQAARVESARRAHLPDFDVSLEYGQRDGLSDLVSAVVAMPIPVRRRSRQDLETAVAAAELAELEAERRARANELRSDVARAHAELERARTQLALFVKSIVPQGRATLESAMSSFQVGRVDFLTVLESQANLFEYETAYHRALADVADRLAELERLVGTEILP